MAAFGNLAVWRRNTEEWKMTKGTKVCMAKQKKIFCLGDKVAYSAAWLKSTGMRTGDYPFLRGTVVAVQDMSEVQLVTIEWTLRGKPYPMSSQYHDDGFGRVIAPNLTLVDRIAIDAALS
jgi:hypothetical protein